MNDYRDGVREGMREGYWTIGKIIPMILLVLALMYGLGFLATGGDLAIYKFWAPKQEAARRQVFEQTKSYNQGMIQELQNMQFQYEQADKAHKDALASIILHRAADYPEESMPNDLRVFVQNLKHAQTSSEINREEK
jgi:hypothetical protein